MAIVKVVHKWSYLLGRKFLIRTDQRSLKYLLEQQITTLDQQKWIVKLMGFDYEIEYKHGRENKAADALSRLPRDLLAMSCPKPAWVDVIRDEACNHPDLVVTREAVARGDPSAASFTVKDGLQWHKGRLVLPSTSQHKKKIIHEFHNTLVGGHSGMLGTYKRLLANFFWVQMKSDIKAFIQQCDTCQRNKYDT